MKEEIPVYDINTTSELRNEDVFISRFAPYFKIHTHLHSPHRHNFYHLILFTKGAGTHTIDFQKSTVKPYQIYFMVPGQVHSWNFDGEVDGYVVNFSTSFFQSFLLRSNYLDVFSFFTGIVGEAVLEIPEEDRNNVEATFEEMLNEAAHNKKLKADFIRILLLKIFILVSRFNTENTNTDTSSSYNQTLLKSFMQLIERNFTNLRLPKEYAELLYITPNHLNALCNDMIGISAGEVIRNRIALEAKRQLINLDLPISDIAYQLNFNDNSYFSKFFKKQVGVTPEEFRKTTLKMK